MTLARLCALALVLAGGSSAPALPPPQRISIELGADSKGVEWRGWLGREGPILLRGQGDHEFVAPLALDYLAARHAFIDSSDAIWLVDDWGKGFRYQPVNRVAEPVSIPVDGQLVTGIAVSDRFVWFGQNGPGGYALARLDRRSGRASIAHRLARGLTLDAFVLAGDQVWLTGGTGSGSPSWRHEVTGLAALDGHVVGTAVRETPWASSVRSGVRIAADTDGSAWVASARTNQVERLAPGGEWQAWTFGSKVPSDLALAQGRALVLTSEYESLPGSELMPPFQPQERLSRRELAVLEPASERIATLPLPGPLVAARFRKDAAGRVWLSADTRVEVVAGRPRLVSSAP